MSGMVIDASELSALGRRMALADAVAHAKLAATVKKAAQNVKTAVNEDLGSSSHGGIRKVRSRYDLGYEGSIEYADVYTTHGPGDPNSLANIAFFGTGKGGGSHEFFGHAVDELPTFSDYVADAAGDALEVLLWGA